MHSASSAVVLATLAISSLRVVATASAGEVPGRGTKQGIAQWAAGRNFLRAGLLAESDVKAFLSDELSAAGATSRSVARQHLEEIRQSMNTMYTSLPKNLNGKLTHQAVRYALHRYFVHRHGWFIRGLEPNNDTWHGAADPDNHNSAAMSEWVPSYLQDILELRLGQDGTDLNQLAALAAALGDLIRKEEKGRLEAVYRMYELPVQPLARELADDLLLTYYVAFLNSGDFSATSQKQARLNTQDFISDYTGWAGAYSWLEELKNKYLASTGNGYFIFQDLAHLVDKMGEEYYVLNDRDCDDLKETLRAMQGVKPGRVRLSQFYHKGMYSHWDFAEKREYLSALGVLDESDPEHPFVVIANYAMARPNCLDSSNLFTICCRNECEDLMGNLESEIGSSTAEPARVAELVAAMPSATIGAHRVLPAQLTNRLEEIAARHGGQVPLHGRLFTQWMHHAYPLECPYPHEMGTVNPLTRSEWIKETGHDSARNTATEATRTPTPKMLLDMKSGAIHWPVYQFGGQSGSGMLLSAQALRKNDKKTPINNDNEPGRENFQLVPGGASQLEIENKSKTVKNSQNYTNQNETKSFSKAAEEDERKLIGWLQVRNPNNRKKTFLQVVNPKPEGPFRKAPWHGNVHVMKF